MKKRICFFLILSFSLISPITGSLTQAQSPSLFADVPLGHWAYDYIMPIYNAGITAGCSQNPLMYCPEDFVTREQMAVFITRALNQVPPDGYCGTTNPFSDVHSDRWSCKYVKRLAELGISTGYGDGRFGPEDAVTREQMAVFIVKALASVPPDGYCGTTDPFTDVSFNRWSCKYVKELAELGITTGYGDGRFGPDDYVTRDQMAVFLLRAFLTGRISLAWGAPTTNSDGSPLTDLAGYYVYYGTALGVYGSPVDAKIITTDANNVVTYTLTGLTHGQTYFIAVTAYDTFHNESQLSNEVGGVAK